MWFKTRNGLVCVEGTVEVLATRYTLAGGDRSVGVYAYQANHADVEVPLPQGPVKVYNRKVYLACFPEDEWADDAVVEVMRRIEQAVRAGEPVCDLSALGD